MPILAGPRAVTFNTLDGTTLSGTLYGNGKVAVIFSNMGDKHEESWAAFAQTVAEAGYLALTYDFRYWVNGKMQEVLMKHVAEDLSAAVSFVREQGAEQVVLVGASMGGMATAKTAASTQATAAIILAAPLEASGVGVLVQPEEVQAIAVPKLFITSENDRTVEPEALQAMYELAVEPKELVMYPGTAHGTDLFKTESGAELQKKILEFIQTHAPIH
jgi:dienelactone hydrolase